MWNTNEGWELREGNSLSCFTTLSWPCLNSILTDLSTVWVSVVMEFNQGGWRGFVGGRGVDVMLV